MLYYVYYVHNLSTDLTINLQIFQNLAYSNRHFLNMKVKLRNANTKEVVVDISKCNETEVLFAHASKEFGFSLEYTFLIFRGCFVSTFNYVLMCMKMYMPGAY